ncbi:hypothetical protein XELAEV_18011667mg [Xenopus laevis]|uniref:Uncharacterized protein n=1 Tax=Xenopus laevis TaxID=8355 RepID=A0A974DL83_XENLA|nr:hypothetical protein XELAEV_18011667mg [Xenopus laevis]
MLTTGCPVPARDVQNKQPVCGSPAPACSWSCIVMPQTGLLCPAADIPSAGEHSAINIYKYVLSSLLLSLCCTV